jgi:hypothetical protein
MREYSKGVPMNERRKSCCDEIVKATTGLKTIESDIKGLKGLYKPVYGLCIMFMIGAALILGLRSDTKDVNASVTINRELHTAELKDHEAGDNAEFYEHKGRLSNLEGRYEAIQAMLKEIRTDQKEILKWQREHQ